MRTVNMTVVFTVAVPDETIVDDLTLDKIACEWAGKDGGVGEILSYETVDCEEIHGEPKAAE